MRSQGLQVFSEPSSLVCIMTDYPRKLTAAESMGEFSELARSVVRRGRRHWVVFALFLVLGPVAFLVAPRVRVPQAYLPTRPYKHRPIPTGGVAALIVVALGGLVTLGLGHMDQRVATTWDVARLGIGPIAMVVPRAPRRPVRRKSRD